MQRSAARCDASPSRRRLSPSRQGRRHSRPGPGIEIPWRPRSSRSFPGEMWILSCSPARRQGEGRLAQTAVSLPIGGFSVTLNTVASIPEELVRMGCIMNRIARLFLIGTMAFVLVVLMPLSAQASQALTRVEHPNVLVTIDPEASSQNEATIAAFPSDRNVLVATARDTRQASGFSWAGYYRSTDGGATWENALVPGFPGDTSPEGLSSPVHDTPSDKLGGPGNSRVTDKEWIAVDDTGGSCDGNLYMPWALFEGSHGTKIVFQRSTDGGRTWTPILPLSHSPNTQNQGTTVA